MPVCKYFLQGRCQYGNSCRFEHPQKGSQIQKGTVTSSTSRENPSAIRPEDVICHDLKEITLQWPFTCYGLNISWERGQNIINGDISPEEMRADAYSTYTTCGNIAGHISRYEQQKKICQHESDRILEDPRKAVFVANSPLATNLDPTKLASINYPTTNNLDRIKSNGNFHVAPNDPQYIQLYDADFTLGNIPECPP